MIRLTVDDVPLEVPDGTLLVDAAARIGVDIPTLCHDGRLDPAGCCRMCLVEIDGERRLAPSCARQAADGMVIRTTGDRIERHRQALLGLYLADHTPGGDARAAKGNKLVALAEAHGAVDLPRIDSPRHGRPADTNPYIDFDAASCILCARCVRYCDEVESVEAIGLAGRGGHTTIATANNIGLLDSTCELCGGCIDVCPTGALSERKPIKRGVPAVADRVVRSTCNFCGVGCQVDLHVKDDRLTRVTSPPPGQTVNDGNLCVKGRFAYDFVHHPERLTTPMVRDAAGVLQPTTWEHALQVAADGLQRLQATHGTDAIGFVSSARCTGEENYMLQKVARAAFGTNNCHQCAAT